MTVHLGSQKQDLQLEWFYRCKMHAITVKALSFQLSCLSFQRVNLEFTKMTTLNFNVLQKKSFTQQFFISKI